MFRKSSVRKIKKLFLFFLRISPWIFLEKKTFFFFNFVSGNIPAYFRKQNWKIEKLIFYGESLPGSFWKKTVFQYVFNKNSGIYSVSRRFWPVDCGSFFWGGIHIFIICKIYMTCKKETLKIQLSNSSCPILPQNWKTKKLKNRKTEKQINWIHIKNLFLDLSGKFNFSIFLFFNFSLFQFLRKYAEISAEIFRNSSISKP